MMRSLFSAVAGLSNHQTGMDVIGANISNVNTVGYKGSRTSFQDVISQTMQSPSASSNNRGGTNAIQVGMGVGLSAVDTIVKNGSYQPTDKQTDLAIQNEGYFVVSDGLNKLYTRAGNFDFDSIGNYVLPGSGLKVQGWNAVNGVLDSTGQVTNIVVPAGQTIAATATTEMKYINNLSASDTPGTSTTTSRDVYDSLGKTHALITKFTKLSDNTWLSQTSVGDGSTVSDNLKLLSFNTDGSMKNAVDVSVNATVSSNVAIDGTKLQMDNTSGSVHSSYFTVSAGSPASLHVLKTTFTQVADNKWDYAITDTANGATTALRTGTLSYAAASGYSDSASATTFSVDGTNNITFSMTTTGTAPSGALFNMGVTTTPAASYTAATTFKPVTFDLTGANKMSVDLNYNGLTQYGTETTVQASEQNGTAAGTLESISVDNTGKIVGKFSNGSSKDLAQVAMATFTNPGGLIRNGGTLFSESSNSGFASIGTSGTGSRGEIQSGTLEMANIDLAEQFSKMIITQRGFQSNSKIISVSDEMLEILASLKR